MAWVLSRGQALADYVSRSLLRSDAQQPAGDRQPLAHGSSSAADTAAAASAAVLPDTHADSADLYQQRSQDFAILPDEQRSFEEAPEWQGSELPRNWFSWRNLWVRYRASDRSSAAICAMYAIQHTHAMIMVPLPAVAPAVCLCSCRHSPGQASS